MSADLVLHAMSADMTDADIRCFFQDTLGSRYFSMLGGNRCIITRGPKWQCEHWKRVSDSDSVWIGEVSWLKANLTGDDAYVPEPVEAVHDLIGESLPVLDDALRQKILTALVIRNERGKPYETVQDHGGENVVKWLDEHMGARLFTVSW